MLLACGRSALSCVRGRIALGLPQCAVALCHSKAMGTSLLEVPKASWGSRQPDLVGGNP